MLSNCGAEEDSWEFLGWQGNQTSVSQRKSSLNIHGRTDAEAVTPILRPPDAKNWLIGKDPDAGKDWGQEEKGMTQDYMVGWYHWLNGHEFEATPGDGEGQGSLACCSPWGHKESDTSERLNNIWDRIHIPQNLLTVSIIQLEHFYLLQKRNQTSHLFPAPAPSHY